MSVKPQIKAQQIIKMLSGRKGFDGWWDGIDEDIQDEIIEEMADILETTWSSKWGKDDKTRTNR